MEPNLNMANSLWAWVTEYPDGSVGMIASTAIKPGMMMPMIGRSERHMRMLEPHARAHGKALKQRVWLRRYACVMDYPDE